MKLFTNTLYIVSTPIGNLKDITLRAIEVLKNSDIILCEDTRHSIKLFNHYSIKKKLVPYHKFNEKKQINNVIEHINRGKILSVVSDAGTPILSDPGNLLLNECIKNKIKICPIPGVSSITTAMSVSGFGDKFLFYGFLPKTENQVDKVLNSLSEFQFPIIFFIQPLKINFYIEKFKKYFTDRKITICKEMTKLHEDFSRDDIKDYQLFRNQVKGEITAVISDKKIIDKKSNEKKIINMAKKFLKKYSVKDTVDLIMQTENEKKKIIYNICLNLKNDKKN